MSKVINHDTLVPIGVAIAVIGAVSMWVADVTNTSKAHATQIHSLVESNTDQVKLIHEINSRLSRIEWRLERESEKK